MNPWKLPINVPNFNVLFSRNSSPKERPSPSSQALKVIYELSVSNKPVNCFDWSPDRAGLAVCSSFDKKLRIIASINSPVGQ